MMCMNNVWTCGLASASQLAKVHEQAFQGLANWATMLLLVSFPMIYLIDVNSLY